MSAPAKEPQPLGSTTGKREDVRICVRCGKEMQMVGRNAKYCLLCRGEVYLERARAYRASHHASANTGACPSAQKIRFCQRCGQSFEVPSAGYARAKYCLACRPIVESEQHAASYERKKSARSFAGPYMTNPRPADVATRAAAKAQVGEDRLRLLSNVADWAGISYGQLMLKSPSAREALILEYKEYKASNGGTTDEA